MQPFAETQLIVLLERNVSTVPAFYLVLLILNASKTKLASMACAQLDVEAIKTVYLIRLALIINVKVR